MRFQIARYFWEFLKISIGADGESTILETNQHQVPAHLIGLVKRSEVLSTRDNHPIEIWDFHRPAEETVLSDWAVRFRRTYCKDDHLEPLRAGTGYTKNREFLENVVFPSATEDMGPATRSGDFGELLVADYIEFCLEYWVPRNKYGNKQIRNESMKGIDVLGMRIIREDGSDPKDSLLAFEVKSRLTGSVDDGRLQIAVTDSAKDHLKVAETLNAMKQRFLVANDSSSVKRVQRFQNPTDKPFDFQSGAAAVLSTSVFDENEVKKTDVSAHWNRENLVLVVIRGDQMMQLVHDLYRRAADEA